MKSSYRWVHIVFFGIIGFGLIACQTTNANHVSCESASNPFDDNPAMSESEYKGGYFPNIQIGRVCEFNGQVAKGQVYKQEIMKDLVFCLKPDELGWEIAITNSLQNDCVDNFSVPVTPPWHGENPIFIGGYQFRNEDNTGENDGSVNVPQKTRGFNFVFNHEDYEIMQSAYRCTYWNIDCPTEALSNTKVEVYRSRGILTITDLNLGNLMPNERAWIESMKFQVKIYLPAK